MADPQLVTADGLARLTLDQIADLHELLDLREFAARKAQDKTEKKR